MNYYNEYDKKAAAWLEQLIKEGLIPHGTVDTRDVRDVSPSDLDGYTQCHFFAGIGGWAHALRLADWPDDRPVWTGSCPCQPFSSAGKGAGVNDPRHLWPAFRWLISKCRPSVVFGEQVASGAGREWLSGVRLDLEAMGYDCGGADLCAAGVGAPHIRQRLWWVAENTSSVGRRGRHHGDTRGREGQVQTPRLRADGGLADDERERSERRLRGRQDTERQDQYGHSGRYSDVDWSQSVWWPCRDGKWRRVPGRLANSEADGCVRGEMGHQSCQKQKDDCRGQDERMRESCTPCTSGDGRLSDAESRERGRLREPQSEEGPRTGDQLHRGGGGDACASGHDGLEVEPALFPLADGVPGRVGLLRGAGNAIVPQVAETFIRAYMEVLA